MLLRPIANHQSVLYNQGQQAQGGSTAKKSEADQDTPASGELERKVTPLTGRLRKRKTKLHSSSFANTGDKENRGKPPC